MRKATLYRWDGAETVAIDEDDFDNTTIEVADSFLVSEGRTFALGLHQERFFEAVHVRGANLGGLAGLDLQRFWDTALALIPTSGDWFPRFELHAQYGVAHILVRIRASPPRSKSAILATIDGPDPRLAPETKGPDLVALLRARSSARQRGADDAVILTREGYVVDGTTSALVWWRGTTLCAPPAAEEAPEFVRVDSVTTRGVVGIAAVLGTEIFREQVTPAELSGTELWALSALHGIRIVTQWIDGPDLAELPGRLRLWRERREALLTPIGVTAT